MPAPDKRGKSKPRPLGRPRPAKGAARRKKTTPAATTSPLAQRAIAQRSASRPAPAFGAARFPKTRAALYQKYGLVFDPSGEDSPINQAELDSLLELYRRSAGAELDTQSDVRKALEDAGLIGKPKGRLTKPVEDLYASAMDALDAFDREAGPYVSDQAILGGASRLLFESPYGLGPLRSAAGFVADQPAPRMRRFGVVEPSDRTIGEVAGEAARTVAREGISAAKDVAAAPFRAARKFGRTQVPIMGLPPEIQASVQERAPTVSDVVPVLPTVGRGVERLAAVPSDVIRAASEAPIPLIGLPPQIQAAAQQPARGDFGAGQPRLADVFATATAGMSEGEQMDVIVMALGDIEDEQLQASEFMFLLAAAEGMPSSDLNVFRQANNLGPLTPEMRQRLVDAAIANGWDMQDPAKYTDADIAKRAFTKPSPVGEAARGVFRQIGEFAAAPIAIPAITSAVASGDPQEMEQMLRFMFAPYTGLYSDYQRRGLGSALSAFAQEYPLDAVLLFNAVLRTAGRLSGAAARTVGGTNALGATRLPTPAEGSLRARLGRFAEPGRAINVEGPEFNQEAGKVVSAPLTTPSPVAFTGRNLLDTALQELYALGLTWGMKSRVVGGASRRLAGRRQQKATRRAENLSDDVGARLAKQITSLVDGLGSDQLTKLALLLVANRRTPKNETYNFGQRAEFFQGQAADARRAAEEATGTTRRDLLAQAARFDRQAAFARQMDETPLDDAVVEEVREQVREIGGDNDAIIAVIIDGLDATGNRNALQRTTVRMGDLRVGDRIDIGFEGDTVPARITSIERQRDGSLKVQRQNLLDPNDVYTFTVQTGARVTRLRPSVNAAKYVRQFIEWDELIQAAAKDVQKAENLRRTEEARAANAPFLRLEKLIAQREVVQRQLDRLANELEEASLAGNRALARRKQRSIQIRTRNLLRKLREMERVARGEADRLRAAGRADEADSLLAFADRMRQQRADIVLSRGVRGRFAREAEELVPADEAAVREAGLLRRLRGGRFTPRNIERVRQPEARELLERAERAEREVASLRRLEEDLLEQRRAAPTSAQASRARRTAREAREDVGTLVRESRAAGRAPEGLSGALDALQRRLEFVTDRRLYGGKSKGLRAATRDDRTEASRILRRLRTKNAGGLRFTDQDLRDLERAELAIRKAENRVAKTAAFRDRPAGVRNLPDGFGEVTVPRVVGGLETAPRRRLEEAAREREVTAERAEEVVAAREAAPPLRREGDVEPLGADAGRMTITDVRRRRKRIEQKIRRDRAEAIKLIEQGRPVVANKFVEAVVARDGESVAFRVVLDKPVFFKIDRARSQVKEEFIAQAELYGDDPVLWLGTRKGQYGGGSAFFRKRELDVSREAGIPRSRLEEYSGRVYAEGLEDHRRAWQNLLTDVRTIRSAIEFQNQLRDLINLVGVVLRDTTPKEAAALNRARNVADDAADDVLLTEAESVVYNAKEFVPVVMGKGKRPVIKIGQRVTDDDAPIDVFLKTIDANTVAKAGGDYVLVPKYLYDAMMREIERIDWQPGKWTSWADRITKQWRNFTLNIFPRTGFANLFGSIMLGLAAGAGPRSFYMAFRYIYNEGVPGPVQLRQRFAMQLTSEASFEATRARLPQRRVTIPGTDRRVSAESPLQGLAWWMNNMRRFNAVSEDFGRLAVWYSRAIPEARRRTGEGRIESWVKMRNLTAEMEDLLDKFARNDPEYFGLAQRFLDDSFEWLGDLHKGGPINTTLRIAFPFQQWYRHILRLTLVTMPLKYPGRTLFLTRLAEIGQDYQREHGVFPPWFVDVMPLFIEEKITEVAGQEFSQKYVAAWRTSNLWPWTTASELVTGEQLDAGPYAQQAVTPIWRNMFFIAYSMLGTAKKPGRYSIDEDVKNAYGDTIDTYSMEGLGYILNLLWRMLPGSTMVMGGAGKAEESGFLFQNRKKMIKGPKGPLPEGALPPDLEGRDLLQLREDFNAHNLIVLLARMTLGGSLVYVPSEGWVSNAQFKSMMNQIESQAGREEKARLRKEAEEGGDENDSDLELQAGETWAEYVRRTNQQREEE